MRGVAHSARDPTLMGMAGLPRGQKDPSAMLEDYDVYVRGNLESTGLGLRGGVVFLLRGC